MLRFTETPVIENTMLLILPFAAYLPADKLDASGVLAVVATGLYFGRYGSGSLTAAARLQQREIWDLIVFLLTGMSFLLVGLELRPILDSLVNRESGSLAIEALAVVGVVIVVRMAWMFAATVLPGGQRLFGGRPGAHPLVAGDHRGRVGRHARGGEPGRGRWPSPSTFPQRDLLVFLTFAVIVATLVGQGLTLPPLIRRLGLVTRDEQDTVLVAEARRRLTVMALSHLDDLTRGDQFPDEVVDRIRIGYESQLARIDRRLEAIDGLGDRGRRGGRSAAAAPPRPVRSTCRPSVSSAGWSSPPSGPSSTTCWPGGRSPSGWPTRCGPPSMSTRPRCAPDRRGSP